MEFSINVKKRILSLFMIILISFTLIISDYKRVEAVVGVDDVLLALLGITIGAVISVETSDDYQDWYDNELRPKWREIVREGLGVIGGKPIDPSYFDQKFPHLGPDLLQELRIVINKRSGTPIENITDDMCKQFVYNAFNNCNFNEDNDTFYASNDYNFILKHFDEVITEDSGYRLVYPFNIQQNLNDIQDGDLYNALRVAINGNNKINIARLNDNPIKVKVFDNKDYSLVFNGYDSENRYYVNLYDYTSWEQIFLTSNMPMYIYDSNSKSFVDGQNSFVANRFEVSAFENNVEVNISSGIYALCSGEQPVFRMFMTLDDLKGDSVGQAPYYVNSDVYNDWSTSQGDYTVTTDNSNHVSYSDVINHNEQYYTEHGDWPDFTSIIKWIDEYEPSSGDDGEGGEGGQGGQGGSSNATATANNEGINVNVYNNHTINIGGGGSVSGNGTVSGNEIQDGGGVGNIFSFLSQIGDVLGSLIKNVGHVLAELVSGISETISALLEGIPTVFGDFMGALLGWLPEELRALITLGISAMIIVGVIKLFRG